MPDKEAEQFEDMTPSQIIELTVAQLDERIEQEMLKRESAKKVRDTIKIMLSPDTDENS